MKDRNIHKVKRIYSLLIFFSLLTIQSFKAQTRILPLGNSITWGKAHKAAPITGEHGYRDHLYTLLNNEGYNVTFVGPQDDGNYDGEWHDGATIENYIPESMFPSYDPNIYPTPENPYDIHLTLDNLRVSALFPDVVLLHIGTNDMNSDQPVTSADRISIYDELDLLMQALLDYNVGGFTIDQIFICKIIPYAPFDDFQGINAKILDYNSKIDLLYNALSTSDKDRVTRVNMHAPFYANQNLYYGPDSGPVDPSQNHDTVHPNETGYQKMADVFSQYYKNWASETKTDEFARAAGALHGRNNWISDSNISIYNVGENGGGAVYCNATSGSWDNLAIWGDTRGTNALTFRIHPNSSTSHDILQKMGILFGMDTTVVNPADPNAATGYMMFFRLGFARIHLVENGVINPGQVASRPFPNPSPGDIIKVSYTISETQMIVDIDLNNGQDSNRFGLGSPILQSGESYYSGLIFDVSSGNPISEPAVMADYIKAKAEYEDFISPAQISDLSVVGESVSTITLEWTPVGDDGLEGQASRYDLRYSTGTINAGNFQDASIVANVPFPSLYNAATRDRVTTKGLLSGTTYNFAIRAEDSYGNVGPISPVATGTTEKTGVVIDNFDRVNLGNDWAYDPSEYSINQGTHEIHNNYTGSWGNPCIYKRRSNPTEIKMVWGALVENPNPSLYIDDNGGLFVMADDTTITADGYLIFVRTVRNFDVIYLFDVSWNASHTVRTFTQLDAVPYEKTSFGGQYPDAGDTLVVIADWAEEEYNRFDIFVNRKAASRFALYDYADEVTGEKRRGNPEDNIKYYSGFMLTQMEGVRNNDVSAFLVAGERSVASQIIPWSTIAVQDTVNQQLGDTLKVKVFGENNDVTSFWPIFFHVTDGGGSVGGENLPVDERMYIEAEWYTDIRSPMVELPDQNAGGGKYIMSTQSGSTDPGYTKYKFYIETQGTYTFWGRTKWNGDWYNRDFRFVFGSDDFSWIVQKRLGYTGDWAWDIIQQGSNAYTKTLSPGLYELIIYTQHKNVPLDRILLTRETGIINIPAIENTGAFETDVNGIASAVWTLGKIADDASTSGINEGYNRVVARPLGTDQFHAFECNAVPDFPKELIKSNDGQSGNAGQQLPLPYIVTLRDTFDNKVSGVTVDFDIIYSLDGTLSPPSPVSNANGQASTYLTLGFQDTIYNVQATVNGVPDTAFFTAEVNEGSGLVGEIEALTAPHTFTKKYVTKPYNLLKVKIYNDLVPPGVIQNTPVEFKVIKGTATPQVQVAVTNSQGVAEASLTMGSLPEEFLVTARAGSIIDTVVIDTCFYDAGLIRTVSGSGQTKTIGQEYTYPVIVSVRKATNTSANAVGIPVSFFTRASGFTFRGGGTVVNRSTDSQGNAQVYVVAGNQHGNFKNAIEAVATDGFYDVQGSPQAVQLYVESGADIITLEEGDYKSGAVGHEVGPLKIRMKKSDGTPVPYQPVTFSRFKGDGHFGSQNPADTLSVLTDNNGYASVWYYLGTQAGTVQDPYNNEVKAYFWNGKNYREVLFHLKAVASTADTITASTTPTHLSGVVRKPVEVEVYVEDQWGNEVEFADVSFLITSGDGYINGSGGDFMVEKTDSLGFASVEWTLGKTVGTDNNILKVWATNGIDTLKGAPMNFYASALPDSISPDSSSVAATSPIVASGTDTSHITITLSDKYGNPISGKHLSINVQPPEMTHPYGPTVPTNSEGKTNAYFVTYSAGWKKVYAKVVEDNLDLSKPASVWVNATSAKYIEKPTSGSGDGQTGNINTVLLEPFAVKITDAAANPVREYNVLFQVIGGGGKLLGSGMTTQTVKTDSLGLANAFLILGPNIGLNNVQAVAPNLTGTPITFSATGQNNAGYKIQNVPGDPVSYTGAAGKKLNDPLRVRVLDIQDRPVYNVSVNFQAVGGGSVSPLSGNTNEYGITQTYFTVGNQSGSINTVEARNNGLAGSPVTFQILVSAGTPQKIEYVSGRQDPVFLNETIQLVVKTMDGFGNDVGTVNVDFVVSAGDATFSQSGTALYSTQSSTSGRATANLVFGTSTDMVKVVARNNFLEGSPVEFIYYPMSSPANDMVIFAGNNQKGTLAQLLVDSLQVKILDQYGNPVKGYSVSFGVISGGGSIEGSSTVQSNSKGIASAQYRVGSTTGTAEIRAVSMKTVTFTVHKVTNAHFPVITNKNDFLSHGPYSIHENSPSPLDFYVTFDDDDVSDLLTFQAFSQGNQPLPPRSGFVQYTQNTASLTFAPTYGQAGAYNFNMRVIDNKGGYDQVPVTVNVIKSNQPPLILGTLPTVRDTSVSAGDLVTFYVAARDTNGDDLSYQWKVDGQTVVADGFPVYHHQARNTSGNETIDVIVSDGQLGASFRWVLEVYMTSVELSDFYGNFDAFRGYVLIYWSTSLENQNMGFEIFRSRSPTGPYEKINKELILSQSDGKYSYIDRYVQSGSIYYYKLFDINSEGKSNEHGPVIVHVPVPDTYELSQNYPNPFNPITTLHYQIPKRQNMTLTIYNIMGQRIITLIDEVQDAGFYTVEWNGKNEIGVDVSSGIYIYRLQCAGKALTRRMIKLK